MVALQPAANYPCRMNGIFVFLDILGFKSYVDADLVGAALMLESQRNILSVGLSDTAWYKNHGTIPDAFQAEHLTTTFHHFLPFSDSLCIASAQPDQFLPQLAHFLISTFCFTAHAYEQNRTGFPPENIKIAVIGLSGVTERRNWFPVLWRGGISFGQFECVDSQGIINGQKREAPLLIGEAVVRAVNMEKPGNQESLRKGPRLFCDPYVRAAVTDTRLLTLLVPVPGIPNCEEFLWPAFLYNATGQPENELLQLHDLLRPAVALWRSKQGTKYECHYFEFIRLICRSALTWAATNGLGVTQARAAIVRSLNVERAGELEASVLS